MVRRLSTEPLEWKYSPFTRRYGVSPPFDSLPRKRNLSHPLRVLRVHIDAGCTGLIRYAPSGQRRQLPADHQNRFVGDGTDMQVFQACGHWDPARFSTSYRERSIDELGLERNVRSSHQRKVVYRRQQDERRIIRMGSHYQPFNRRIGRRPEDVKVANRRP
jgi:hypothetical protein